MKIKIVASMALLALFAGCNDDYDNQFNVNGGITDVKNITLILEAADYGSISKASANQELALSKDPEGKTFVEALNAVSKDRYFTENAAGEDYIPAFLKSKYPNADPGSLFTVTFNQYREPSEYLADFTALSTYDLTEENYQTVWGENIKASYLSPSTLAKIPVLLKNNVTDAAKGDMKVVNYAYSEMEPSTGGGSGETPEEPVITKISDVWAAGIGVEFTVKGEVVATHAKAFLLKDESGIIMTYLNTTPNFSVGDVVTVSGKTDNNSGKNLLQFPKESVVKVVERKTSFAYPTTAKEMNGAAMDAYLTTPKIEYVTYEGTLSISGTTTIYYNVVVDGAVTAQGSIGNPMLGVVDPALDGKRVKVTGYAVGKGGSQFVTTMVTSVVAADGTSETITPVGVVALSPKGTFTVRGVVAATHTKGFLVTDGTGNILVFKTSDCIVGDVVTVTGATSAYNGIMQFSNTATITKAEKKTFIAPAPQVMTAEDMDAYLILPRIANVSYQGTLSITTNDKGVTYYNIITDGATVKGSIANPADGVVDPALNGQKVIITGYALGMSTSGADKFISTMATSVQAATATTARAFASTRASSQNAAGLYVYDGSAWKEYTTTDAKVTAVDQSVYASLGKQFIEAPDKVLPIYLKQKYPYAAAETKVAVVYNKKAGETVVAEYTLGEQWTETTSSAPVTVKFSVEADGSIQAQASSYLDAPFTKDDGGFVPQNVFLDVVSYVWKFDKSYGYWKASAFASNTNRASESWLVSPAVDLKKAKAPEMVFDHVTRFFPDHQMEEFLNVLVSTDYTGDVTKATWTALKIPNWVLGTDWTFHNSGKIDMSAYIGQVVYVAFKYTSTSEMAPTWEVNKLSIKEKSGEEAPAEE